MDEASIIQPNLVLPRSQTPPHMDPENKCQLQLPGESNATAESNTSIEPLVIALTQRPQSHDDAAAIFSTSTSTSTLGSSTITVTTNSTSSIIPSDPMEVETPVIESKKRPRSKRDASAAKEPRPPARELRTRTRSKPDAQGQNSIQATAPRGVKHTLKPSEAETSPRAAKRIHLDVTAADKGSSSKATKGATSKTTKVRASKKTAGVDLEAKEETKAEKEYEKRIQKRGARIFKPVDVGDPARVVDRWAEVMGVPVRSTSSLVGFPFNDPALFEKEAIAFMFVTPTDVNRQEPVGDKESMEIYFIPQRAAGPGHAIDSCFSLSLMNMILNSPAILAACPEDLRALASEIFVADSATAVWRIFDTSSVGDRVHRAHEETHLLGDWSNDAVMPEFDRRSFAVRLKEQKQKEVELEVLSAAPAAASAEASTEGQQANGDGGSTSEPVTKEPGGDEGQVLEHHITIILPINGAVWEIDSLMSEPRKIAPVGEGRDWQLEVAQYLNSLKDTITAVPKGPMYTYAAAIYRK